MCNIKPTHDFATRIAAIAPKIEAMIHLGMLNSRMKDFFGIWFLTNTFSFDGDMISRAVAATFKRRGTELNKGNIAQLD